MKCIIHDFRRAITGRWFLAAFFATVAALYASIGSQTYALLDQMKEYPYDGFFDLTAAQLLQAGIQGDFGLMTLPALSALPFAAQALTEVKCGAIRPVVFRVGRKGWMAGKLTSTLASGMLLQAFAALGLVLVFHGLMLCCTGTLFPTGDFTPVLPLLLGRMLCGGLWAEAGCLFSLLTETASAAYLAPLCLCYAMVMLGTRFFPQAAFLNPANWPAAPAWALLLGMAALSLWLVWVLERKVSRYV